MWRTALSFCALLVVGCVSVNPTPKADPEETLVLAGGAIGGGLTGVASSLRFQYDEIKNLRRTCKADYCLYPAFSESADPNKNIRIRVKLDKEAMKDMVDGMDSARTQKRMVNVKKRFGYYVCNENFCKPKIAF